MFPPIAYLQWIEGRPAAAEHDLGTSDLRRLPADDPDDLVPSRLRGLSQPSDGRSLREHVAAEYDIDEANVLLTAGATHGGFLACATAAALAWERTADERSEGGAAAATGPAGDEGPRPCALVEVPGYEPLVETPRGIGSRVARFRRPGPEHGLDPARVAAAAPDLSGPLAHVTVTNRHNPTGAVVDRATLAATAEVAADHGGYLLVDEVYAPYAIGTGTDDAAGDAFGGPTGAGLAATVTVGSLTKFHGLGGLRVGWITGPEAFIKRARSVEHHVPALAAPSVALARRFFAHRDDLVADARDHCRRNHELLAGFLADRDDLAGSVEPGSPFAYLEHERADGDAVSAAAWDAGVLVVPGRFFGMSDGVRVSLGRAPDDCEAALDAFGRVLDEL